ncbi:Actin family [Trinorchestia longiramus]|nr:Actin family [Trinorchestia longiramus]
MPLYEGVNSIGLYNEKHTAVIFDFGTAYTKVGFAGEAGPRAIVTSTVGYVDAWRHERVFESLESFIFRRRIIRFIRYLFVRCLLVNPKERRVVVVDNVLGPTCIKEIIAAVLFRQFEAVSVAFVPSHLVSLLTLGEPTGLMVDMGYSEVSVIPVYEGVTVLEAWQALPLGSKAIQENLKELLIERGSVVGEDGKEVSLKEEHVELLTPQKLEDIVVKCCFVTTPERSERLQLNKKDRSNEPPPPPPEVLYPLSGAITLKIPGTVREMAAEILFEKDADNLCLSNIIMDAIVKCPVDTRRDMAASLVMIGGTASLMGLKKRVLQELQALAHRPPYSDRMALSVFKMHKPPVCDNYVAWLGGEPTSVCLTGATSSSTHVLETSELLPSWTPLQLTRYWGHTILRCAP